MNERSAGILLQFTVIINLVTSQIHFPADSYYPVPQNAAPADSYYPIGQNVAPSDNYYPVAQNTAPVYSAPNVPSSQQLAVTDLTAIRSTPPALQQREPLNIVAEGLTKLMLDINRVVPTTSPHLARADNIVYGPVTIAGALTVALLASIGQTFNEIANVLGLTRLNIQNNPMYIQQQIAQLFAKLESDTGLEVGEQVQFATAIFVQRDFPIRPAFHEVSAELYKTNLMNLDFRGHPEMAQNVINAWVSGRTNGKIPTLMSDPPPPDTRAIIASVFYFKAAWEFPFYDGHTKWRPFYVNGRKMPSDRMVEMMSNGGEFPYYKDTNLGVEILGFPYKGGHTTMYVILPNQSNKETLKRLENSLTPADIERLVNSTRYTETVILFPKMKLETTINLRSALQKLGVNSLFNPYQANLALLSPGVNEGFKSAEAPFVSAPISPPSDIQGPPRVSQQQFEDRLIFTRFGDSSNSNSCIPIFDHATNVTRCKNESVKGRSSHKPMAMPLSARAAEGRDGRGGGGRRGGDAVASAAAAVDSLEALRKQLNFNPDASNPGLYADQVIHKVYIDITESGTEAASATGISLNRSGGRVTFRVDMPFLFFIYHQDTNMILFWGSVKSPSPSVATR